MTNTLRGKFMKKLKNTMLALSFGSALLATSTSHSQELTMEILKAQNEALSEKLDALSRSLKGAIVGFDRKEGQKLCPDGWALYQAGQGRMLIGAGDHNNKDRNGNTHEDYSSYETDRTEGKTDSTGGFERITLSPGQMPKHNHTITTITRNAPNSGGLSHADGGRDDYRKRDTEISGNNEPHNNMPPYVAVYFCERILP